jgi:transcriptional regulator GlxA family with amidase domain
MRIAVLVFDGFDELDAIGPYEVLRTAANCGADFDVELVATQDTVVAAHGLQLTVPGRLGQPDGLIVPGGGWAGRSATGVRAEVAKADLPALLAATAPGCRWVASVCTGAMLLAAAGLLTGRPATTHHVAHADLAAAGALLRAEDRVVDDGDRLTAAGVTSGLDLAYWIVEREAGAEIRDRTAAEMEYPFGKEIPTSR